MTNDTSPPGAAPSGKARRPGSVPPERAEAIKAVESEFGELMMRVRRMIHRNADRVSPGMNPGAYKIFTSIVRNGPVKASDIAERMMLDKGQMSRTVKELEDLGLVTRTPDPGDRRASLLEATPHGVARLDEARSGNDSLLYDTLVDWDLDRVLDLADLLHALTNGTAPERR
ncbi:MarR family transcriptional regulator [Microbacterium betulae]|uniref:MarR family transcriptional regulator n=1 Tax=Microbacterium betulae TaxID=2981139 RepID=A0AA97FLP1_9MICO|nr:MarR family transcriptional regulator [Microbacterium sp. AB]WOF23722.1 MarR family transcriptional regulator [Microbacterium sp. AB]